MGHVICITNQKGGVGKTTTAVNLSTALAMAEKGSLLVDCDPQGHATMGIGIDKASLRKTLYHAMMGRVSAAELIADTPLGYLKALPSRIELLRAEGELFSKPGKERILQRLLADLRERYDYILIDTPPALNLLTMNGIVAADSLLIPLQCEFYGLEGLKDLLRFIRILKKRFNPDLRISGILLTMFDSSERLSHQIAGQARLHFKEKVFGTLIPRDSHLQESAGYGLPLLLRDMKSLGSRRYLDLAREIMGAYSGVVERGHCDENHEC
jgi:chromosome partitioning protein